MTNQRSAVGPRSVSTVIAGAVLAVTAALTLAACGGDDDGGGDTGSPTSAAAVSSPPAGTGAAGSPTDDADVAEITRVYTTFFNINTPVSTSMTLLQNGPAFKKALEQQAASPQSQGSSVTVAKVAVLSDQKASVTFSVLINGQPVLENQGGWAVKENGEWKVAGSTFCGLVSLSGTTPAACSLPESTALPS